VRITSLQSPAQRLRLLLSVGGVSFSFSFQFFTRLASVFAEECGDFGIVFVIKRISNGFI